MLRSLCRRRRSVRPRFEALESRITLSNIGVNLSFNTQYAGDYIWIDVHNLFATWGPWVIRVDRAGDPGERG